MLIPPNFVDISSLGLLAVKGTRAKEFLQGQLTCHMDEITPNHSSLAAHCNPKGRIISFFRIFMLDGQYYLQMPASIIPITIAALKKYAVFYKVELVHEPSNSKVIYCGDTIPADMTSKKPWNYFDIMQNIPNIYPETTEKFLPHELNLQNLNAISFNKGCYTGQEIIARMQYRGKLKTHLYRGNTDSLPKRGSDIYDEEGNATGMVVDFCEKDVGFEILFTSSVPQNHFLDAEKTLEIRV